MGFDIKKVIRGGITVLVMAIVFLVMTFLLTISGIHGFFFAYSLPVFNSINPIDIVTTIVLWSVQLVVKLFMLGFFLSIVNIVSAHLVKRWF